MRIMTATRRVVLFAAVLASAAVWACAVVPCVYAAEAPTESQVEAVFVFNFSRFVDWPPEAFAAPTDPFVIGILGSDPFGTRLDEAVRGERIDQHPLLVRRFRNLGELGDCRIHYIDRSESAQ